MTNHIKPSQVDLQEQDGYHRGLSNRQVQGRVRELARQEESRAEPAAASDLAGGVRK